MKRDWGGALIFCRKYRTYDSLGKTPIFIIGRGASLTDSAEPKRYGACKFNDNRYYLDLFYC